MSELLWDEFIYCYAFLDMCFVLYSKDGFCWRRVVRFWSDVGACTGGRFCLWSQGSRAVPRAGGTVLSHTSQILAWHVAQKRCRLRGIPGHVWKENQRQKHPSCPPSRLTARGFPPEWETPMLALLCFRSFPGSGLLTSCKPGSSPPGWYLK